MSLATCRQPHVLAPSLGATCQAGAAMILIDRLGLAQRIIIVVSLGLALTALGTYFVNIGSPFADFGWFGYAPLTNNAFVAAGSDLSAWEQLLVWLGLIAVWTSVSLRLMRPASADDADGHQ